MEIAIGSFLVLQYTIHSIIVESIQIHISHHTDNDNDNSYGNNKEALRLPFKLNPDWIAHKHTNIKNMKVMAKEKKKSKLIKHQCCVLDV